MDLAGALGLDDRALVAFVGAGGKKTAMARLVDEGDTRDCQVGYTTTAHVPPPADLPLLVHEHEAELLADLETAEFPVAFAGTYVEDPERAPTKVAGHDPSMIDRVFEGGPFDWLLVKADGARRREFKAPGREEPVIPREATHVVPVASVQAVGRLLDEETVHRPERVAAIADLALGKPITAEAVGAVLASDDGGCKDVPDAATVTPVINKSDTDEQRATARRAMAAALDRSERFERGIVSSFETEYIEIVEG